MSASGDTEHRPHTVEEQALGPQVCRSGCHATVLEGSGSSTCGARQGRSARRRAGGRVS